MPLRLWATLRTAVGQHSPAEPTDKPKPTAFTLPSPDSGTVEPRNTSTDLGRAVAQQVSATEDEASTHEDGASGTEEAPLQSTHLLQISGTKRVPISDADHTFLTVRLR